MKKVRLFAGLGALVLGGAGAVVVACGGDDPVQCGAGTVLVNGVCQIAATDGSTTDATTPDGDVPDGAPIDDAGTDVVIVADGGDSAVAPNRCPFGKGPAMAEIPNPGLDAGTFCIDRTEVTEAQYDQFLKDKNGNTGGQILDCSFNTRWTPGCPAYVYQYNPGTYPQRPVRCIDWCDAKAFCEWSGKRLCGQLDKSDGPNKATSRWSWTCTNGNATTHPEGAFADDTCRFPNSTDAGPVDVTASGCKGKFSPYSQVDDLLGNVGEWQSFCEADGGGQAKCLSHGGSFVNSSSTFGCSDPAYTLNGVRYGEYAITGIRCCAD